MLYNKPLCLEVNDSSTENGLHVCLAWTRVSLADAHRPLSSDLPSFQLSALGAPRSSQNLVGTAGLNLAWVMR